MSYIVVDVEADGKIPPYASMISFGAVIVKEGLTKTFYSKLKPISDKWDQKALSVSGFSREDTLLFNDPKSEIERFAEWIKENSIGKPIFISDNLAFDWSWINWYFHHFYGSNPFGFSGRRIGDLFCGFYKDSHYQWKKHRKTKYTHHPVDDAKGNAEALLYLVEQGLKIKL